MKIKEEIKILILEDTQDDVIFIENVLQKGGINHTTLQVDSKEGFINGLKTFQPDVILSDHSLPQFNSIEAHKICMIENVSVPFILVTGAVSEEFAVTCLKLGIDDYILKTNLSRLPSAIIAALRQRELEKIEAQAIQELKAQNEEILKINKELDSFIYSISHSLRGPISTVSGLLQLAELESSENTLNIQELHQMMYSCIKKLDNTIGQMVNQGRNARLEITIAPIDIKTLINNSINNLSYLTNFNSLEISITDSSDVAFYSDPYRVEVIITNILSNAIKYQAPFSEKPKVFIVINCTPEHAVITFKDNGLGIHEASMPKIFNMFYRASEKSDGSGLGLYIVKEMIEKLKGTITITSVNNEGTNVTVVLPNTKK